MKACKFSKPCICRICEGCEEAYCEDCDGDPFLYCTEFKQVDETEEARQLLSIVDEILSGKIKPEESRFGSGNGGS